MYKISYNPGSIITNIELTTSKYTIIIDKFKKKLEAFKTNKKTYQWK
jgi:hypothetical protein